MNRSVPEGITQAVGALPEGTPISAKELLHLGQRATVDQALARLTKGGQLMRVARGLYVRPAIGRYGPRLPSASELVNKVGEIRGETVVEHEAVAANSLGLTEQVPVREVFLTSGQNQRLRIGNQVIELRHAPAWRLLLPGRPAGAALRALAWLGPSRAHEAIPTLRQNLSPSELGEVISARSKVPTWLAKEISGFITK